MQAVRFSASILPIAVLLGCVLILRWRAYRAAALAWLLAVGAAAALFGAGPQLLAQACAKGLSLTLLVMLIVWAAIWLYNLADRLGAVSGIAAAILGSSGDRLLVGLLLAWAFSGFLQGIAGFGVPVAVVSPLLVLAGYGPARAVAAVMIGHSWAISFGSMGSSFYALELVTGLPGDDLGPLIARLFFIPICLTGLSVAHLLGGRDGLRRLAPLIVATAAAMDGSMWLLNVLGAPPVASMLPGLLGTVMLWLVGRTRKAPLGTSPDTAGLGHRLPLRWAVLPYALLTLLSLSAQAPVLKEAAAPLHFALPFPAQETASGFEVRAQEAYAPIRLLGHPAPLLLLSAGVTYLVYSQRKLWRDGVARAAWDATVKQAVGMTVGVALMVMTALVLSDSGMAAALADGARRLGGTAYALAAPFIGLLGAFATGSNTNSNVLFGPLQGYAARALALSPLLIAAGQAIGGSIGSGVAPDKALLGASVLSGDVREGDVLRCALPYGLLVVLAVGLEVVLLSTLGYG